MRLLLSCHQLVVVVVVVFDFSLGMAFSFLKSIKHINQNDKHILRYFIIIGVNVNKNNDITI